LAPGQSGDLGTHEVTNQRRQVKSGIFKDWPMAQSMNDFIGPAFQAFRSKLSCLMFIQFIHFDLYSNLEHKSIPNPISVTKCKIKITIKQPPSSGQHIFCVSIYTVHTCLSFLFPPPKTDNFMT
jgi:hypothetical protein